MLRICPSNNRNVNRIFDKKVIYWTEVYIEYCTYQNCESINNLPFEPLVPPAESEQSNAQEAHA